MKILKIKIKLDMIEIKIKQFESINYQALFPSLELEKLVGENQNIQKIEIKN